MTTQFTGNNSTNTTTDRPPTRSRDQEHGGASPEDHRFSEDRTLSHGTPSAPLLGRFPAARWIPMDVHSMMDYGNVLAAGVSAVMTDCTEAKVAGFALATANLAVSSLTDYRLSVAKTIPIEAHETLDYVWGAAAVAAPFVFGYWKKAPMVALSHVIAGAFNILGSLITDYRASRGSAQQHRAHTASAR